MVALKQERLDIAEKVANIPAEKPLYRVACGDLGTEPTDQKEYLDSVLGKIWDCVVLLDEADIYLEERSTKSLARNAACLSLPAGL